jgi:hypothetical protein
MQIATLIPKEDLAALPDDQHFRAYNRALALNLVEMFDEDIESQTLTFAQRMELYKITAKFGDMEPRPNALPAGTGFSIKIMLGDEELTISNGENTYDNEIDLDSAESRTKRPMTVTDEELLDVPLLTRSRQTPASSPAIDPFELAPPLQCLSVFPSKEEKFLASLKSFTLDE